MNEQDLSKMYNARTSEERKRQHAPARAVEEHPDDEVIFSEKQQEVLDFAQDGGFMALASGAIRSGKTYAAVRAFVDYIMDPSRQGYRHLICTQSAHLIRGEIVPLMNTICQERGRDTICTFNGRNFEVYIGWPDDKGLVDRDKPHTTCMVVCGETRDTFHRVMGQTLHTLLFDEATLVDESFFRHSLGRLTFPDSKAFVCCNPGSPRHWLRQNYIVEGKFDLNLTFNFEDNPILGEEIKERLRGLYVEGTSDYERYVLGRWAALEGAVYPRYFVADVEGGLADSAVPLAERIGRIWVGHDHGFVDPCVFQYVLELDFESRLDVRFLGGERVEQRTVKYIVQPALRIENEELTDLEIIQRFVDHTITTYGRGKEIRFMRDQAPVAQNFQKEFRQYNARVLGKGGRMRIRTSAASPNRDDGISRLRGLLSTGEMVIDARCDNLLQEIDGYQYDPRRLDERPLDGNDHHLDALRYVAYHLKVPVAGQLRRQA